MEMELVVRFDYGAVPPWVQATGDGLTMVAGSDALRFHSPVRLEGREDLSTVAAFTVGVGHTAELLARVVLRARGPADAARRARVARAHVARTGGSGWNAAPTTASGATRSCGRSSR